MFHIDYIQIPEAKIDELSIALSTELYNEPRPIDVLVIAGEGEMDSDENAARAYQKIIRLEQSIKSMNTNNTVSFAKIDSLFTKDVHSQQSIEERTKSFNEHLEAINNKNGMDTENFYGRTKYIRPGKPIKERKLSDGVLRRMGKQVEVYFAKLYGVGELISTRKVLSAAEERRRLSRRSVEKLARRCAGLEVGPSSSDSEDD